MVERTATRRLAVGYPTADGHFPGNPIIPGAVLLREIIAAVTSRGGEVECREIRSAKFHRPVRPGDTLEIAWTEGADGDVRFSCAIAGAGRPDVTGMLRLSAS